MTVDLADTALNTGEALGDTYSSVEALYGSGSADTLIGDMNQNWLRGGAGGDVLDGGGGGFDWVLYDALPGRPASAVTVDLLTPGLDAGRRRATPMPTSPSSRSGAATPSMCCAATTAATT